MEVRFGVVEEAVCDIVGLGNVCTINFHHLESCNSAIMLLMYSLSDSPFGHTISRRSIADCSSDHQVAYLPLS